MGHRCVWSGAGAWSVWIALYCTESRDEFSSGIGAAADPGIFQRFLRLRGAKEGISNSLKVGMAFAAVGLVCFSATAYQATPESAVRLFGLVLTLMAALRWALSNIFVRLAQRESADFDPLAFIVSCSAIPVLPIAALTWLFDRPTSHAHWLATPWIAWAALAFLGCMNMP